MIELHALFCALSDLRNRHIRRRLVETLARRLGMSRSKANKLASRIP